MKSNIWILCLILLILSGFGCNVDCEKDKITGPPTEPTPESPPDGYLVLVNGQIVPETGFGMGIDDSRRFRNWMSTTTNSLKMQYPGGLDWGAVFITVSGNPVPPPRPSQDFSQYTKLAIEMKGASGGECVQVGMKDANNPDDGFETKLSVQLTTDWKTYEFNLSNFSTCRLSRVYVVTEFVFPCSAGQNGLQTIDVKTIKFLDGPSSSPGPKPTATPKSHPTATPKPQPTATPKPQPTATPKPQPTATPKSQPAATPKPQPTATPTQASLPDFAITYPWDNQRINERCNVIMRGVGMRSNYNSVVVKVYTNQWYTQIKRFTYIGGNEGAWEKVIDLGGQDSDNANNHTITITVTYTDGTQDTDEVDGVVATIPGRC